jgi:hypothetical protein
VSEPLLSRYRRLVAEVAGHKSALTFHRKSLRAKAAELDAIKAECAAAGINIVTVSRSGTGAIHSHADRSS